MNYLGTEAERSQHFRTTEQHNFSQQPPRMKEEGKENEKPTRGSPPECNYTYTPSKICGASVSDPPYSPDCSSSSQPKQPLLSNSFKGSPASKLPALSPIKEIHGSPQVKTSTMSPPANATPMSSSLPALSRISPESQPVSPEATFTADSSAGSFTINQWQELEKQALIFKYIVSGSPVPQDMIASLYAGGESAWLTPIKLDLEPLRCRRTDGKKWRCSREAVTDHKYCERHMHRGRNRSRRMDCKSNAGSSASIAAASTDGLASEPSPSENPNCVADSANTQEESQACISNADKNDNHYASSPTNVSGSGPPPLTLPPPVHPMGPSSTPPLNTANSSTTSLSSLPSTRGGSTRGLMSIQSVPRLGGEQQDQPSGQHVSFDQRLSEVTPIRAISSTSSNIRVHQYQLNDSLGPRFTSSFQPGQQMRVNNHAPVVSMLPRPIGGVGTAIVGLGGSLPSNVGPAGGSLQPGHYQVQHTHKTWETGGDNEQQSCHTPSCSRVPLLRLPAVLQRSASLQYFTNRPESIQQSYQSTPVATPDASSRPPSFLVRCSSVPEAKYSRHPGMTRSQSVTIAPQQTGFSPSALNNQSGSMPPPQSHCEQVTMPPPPPPPPSLPQRFPLPYQPPVTQPLPPQYGQFLEQDQPLMLSIDMFLNEDSSPWDDHTCDTKPSLLEASDNSGPLGSPLSKSSIASLQESFHSTSH